LKCCCFTLRAKASSFHRLPQYKISPTFVLHLCSFTPDMHSVAVSRCKYNAYGFAQIYAKQKRIMCCNYIYFEEILFRLCRFSPPTTATTTKNNLRHSGFHFRVFTSCICICYMNLLLGLYVVKFISYVYPYY
jgi:hypothetical protein